MDSAQDVSNQDMDNAVDGMQESEAVDQGNGESHETPETSDHDNTNDPLYVQKRLKQQKRAHEREIRELHARIGDLQSRVSQPASSYTDSPYGGHENGAVDEQIHKAVSYALQHKDMEERKAKEAQSVAHVHKQYQELNKHLDNTADKYEDFDDVVRGEEAPYTSHMRDAALFLPKNGAGSAGEVLYKLGKNPEELTRISKLHPLDQAAEMVKLSHALISGGEQKGSSPRPLGQIKANPVTNSHVVTDKTPIGNIRQRMKQGNWK